MEPVEYKVITPDNASAQFEAIKAKGSEPVFIGVTPKGYEALARNIEKIQGYSTEQKEIIRLYKDYYETK